MSTTGPLSISPTKLRYRMGMDDIVTQKSTQNDASDVSLEEQGGGTPAHCSDDTFHNGLFCENAIFGLFGPRQRSSPVPLPLLDDIGKPLRAKKKDLAAYPVAYFGGPLF